MMTRCLIVDSSAVIRKVAKRILTTQHDFVMEAENGIAALAALHSKGADIVMVDGDIADVALTDFIRQVRLICEHDQPQIVVMMTEMDLVTMTKAKRAGANDYLLKPFDRMQLTRRVQEFKEAA
jgi:two-component system chemotaxis response regulator CheY